MTLLTWYCTTLQLRHSREALELFVVLSACYHAPLLGFAVNWSCQCSFCAVQCNAKITSPFGPYSTKVHSLLRQLRCSIKEKIKAIKVMDANNISPLNPSTTHLDKDKIGDMDATLIFCHCPYRAVICTGPLQPNR